MGKIVEKHITVTEDTHKQLSELAKKERRSMRTVASKLIEDEYNKKVKKDDL